MDKKKMFVEVYCEYKNKDNEVEIISFIYDPLRSVVVYLTYTRIQTDSRLMK